MRNGGHVHRHAGRRRVRGWPAFVAVVVLALGACGGDDGGDTSTDRAAGSTTTTTTTSDADADAEPEETSSEESKGDFCRLVTKAEADALGGKDLGEGTASASTSPVGEVGSCVYKIIEGGRVTTIVNLAITGTEVPRDVYDSELGSGTPVSGVGEAATLIQPGILSVFDDGLALTVQVLVDMTPASTEQLVEVARKALDRF